MEGSARLTDEPMNGVRNDANAVTDSTDRLSSFFSHSLFLLSIMIVTGPSLTSSTSIIAPKTPVAEVLPRRLYVK